MESTSSTLQPLQSLNGVLTSWGDDQLDTSSLCLDLACFYGTMAREMFVVVLVGFFALIIFDMALALLLIERLLNEEARHKMKRSAFSAIVIRIFSNKNSEYVEDEEDNESEEELDEPNKK